MRDHKPEAVLEPPRRGRPPADQPGSTVCTWLPASYHDRLIQLANQREQSVSSLVRSLLILRLR